MWRQIRGMGLSYHYQIRCQIEAGYIKFILYRSAQVVQAFEEAKKIMVQQTGALAVQQTGALAVQQTV